MIARDIRVRVAPAEFRPLAGVNSARFVLPWPQWTQRGAVCSLGLGASDPLEEYMAEMGFPPPTPAILQDWIEARGGTVVTGGQVLTTGQPAAPAAAGGPGWMDQQFISGVPNKYLVFGGLGLLVFTQLRGGKRR